MRIKPSFTHNCMAGPAVSGSLIELNRDFHVEGCYILGVDEIKLPEHGIINTEAKHAVVLKNVLIFANSHDVVPINKSHWLYRLYRILTLGRGDYKSLSRTTQGRWC